MPMRCPSNVIPMRPFDVLYLCERMREDEREQLAAFFDMPPEDWPGFFLAKRGPRFTVVDAQGMPLVAGGWESVSQGVMQSWMLGSEEAWRTHWRSITRAVRWSMDALLACEGIWRLQTNALASRTAACEWYVRGMRMRQEGIWHKFGRQQQDVACFARVKEN